MRPTLEDQLLGMGRLIDELAAAPELSDESAALVLAARKQLQRLAGSVASRPAFLRWDNTTMCALLDDLAPLLSVEVQRLIADSCGTVELADAETQNEELRRLLVVVIDALPDDEAGDLARLPIIDHLRARAAANPALHKHPQRPWDATSDQPATEKATM